MDKDYRLELLTFLKEHYPDKANISYLIQNYLSETKSSKSYYNDMLTKLKTDGFVLVSTSDLHRLALIKEEINNDSIILASLTHPGLDEWVRVKKQKYDLSNAERVYKTYSFTRFAAIFGLISGAILLIVKLLEVFGILLFQK